MSEILGPNDPENMQMPNVEPQAKTPEKPEASIINFEQLEGLMSDGSADEYVENVGAIPIEGLLEEQGDERTVDQLSQPEREYTESIFTESAAKKGWRVESDASSCIARAA